MSKQWKMVPVEPTPEMLAEIHLVPDFTERALRVRYAAMLAAAPQPPSASDERERFEAWGLAGCEMVDDPASGRMDIARHCAWEAWQARAALAPSPGVDAAEQKPADPMDWPLPCDVTVGAGTMRKGVALRTLVLRMKMLHEMAMGTRWSPKQEAASSPAASPEWLAEAERLVDAFFLAGSSEPRSFNATESARAALLAHLKKGAE